MKTSARYKARKIKIYVQHVCLGDGRNLVVLKVLWGWAARGCEFVVLDGLPNFRSWNSVEKKHLIKVLYNWLQMSSEIPTNRRDLRKKAQKLEFWMVLPIIWRKCESPVLALLCLNWDIMVWVPEFINPKKKDSLTGAARRFVCEKLEIEGNGEGWFNSLLGEHNEMGLPAGPAPHRGASSLENSLAALKTNTSLRAHQIPYLILLPSLFDFGYFLVVICLFA